MSKDKVAVTFLKSWRGYSAGEVACFSEVAAGDLVKGNVAELLKGGKAAAKPAAKPAASAGPAASAPDEPAPGAGTGADEPKP